MRAFRGRLVVILEVGGLSKLAGNGGFWVSRRVFRPAANLADSSGSTAQVEALMVLLLFCLAKAPR